MTMGGFYGNITLLGVSQKAVAEALRGRRAIVGPSIRGYVVAFDSVCDDQDTDAMHTLTLRLSAELCCSALTILVHDDDVFMYFLYHDGSLIDTFNSCPGYFGSEAQRGQGGDAEALSSAFGMKRTPEIEKVLRSTLYYACETERHSGLVHLLGLPDYAIGKALASFDRGEYPVGLSADQMLRAADPPPVEDPELRRDREFYEQLGPENPSSPYKREGCRRGAIPLSVLCKRHHFEMIKRRACPFDE